MDLHSVLARQLKRLGLAEDRAPEPGAWAELLRRVDRAYRDGDQERYTLERSLALSSEEMGRLYEELKASSESALSAERDKLKESEKRYARAVQGTNDGIWDWDIAKGVAYFSPRCKAQLGYGDQELEGLRPDGFEALLHPADLRRGQETLRRHLQERAPYDVEFRLRQKDGNWCWIRARGQAEWNRDGQPVRMAGSHSDISAQKAAEGALRESEARFRALVGNVPGAVFRLLNNTEFTIQFMSDGIEPISGYAAADFTSGAMSFRDFLPEELRGEVLRAVSRSLATYEPFEIEFQVAHRNGSLRWVSVEARGVTLEDSLEPCLDGIILDITRLKEQQEELQRAKEVAEAATLSKSEFLANMSHEIRTPMNGVLGMTGFLLDTSLNPEQREYAETVRSCADGLLEILNDILDFSKIEAGKLDLELLPFDLREVVEDALAMAAPKAAAKGLELAYTLAPDLPRTLLGDAGRIRQILVNLVGNAVKFTERGQVLVRVERGPAFLEKAVVAFTVEDSGIGIPEAVLPRLFRSFSQADGSMARRFGGTGLGLAISRQLAEAMGGGISVESTQGVGSQFHFTLCLPPVVSGTLLAESKLVGRRVALVAAPSGARACHVTLLEALGLALTLYDQASTRGYGDAEAVILDVVSLGEEGLGEERLAAQGGAEGGPPALLLMPAGKRPLKGCHQVMGRPLRLASLQEGLLRAMGLGKAGLARSAKGRTQRKGRILVAEDNPVNQKVIVKILERMGLRVDVVANGLEAVEAVARLPYDLVLMDCQMPEMNGFEATAAIRRQEAGAHLPIVALTAHAMQGEMDRCLQAGMDDYTTKPLRMAELERVLDQYLPDSGPEAESEIPLDPPILDPAASQERPPQTYLEDLVTLFRRDLPTRVDTLERALAEGRYLEGASMLHSLRGVLGTLGALEAEGLAEKMEKGLRDGRRQPIQALEGAFHESLRRFLAGLG